MSVSSTATPTKLWYTRCGAATASGLAIRQGWLQDAFSTPDTQLQSLRDSPELAIRNAHYHHGLSGLFREGGNIPPIWAKAGGADTVVLGITWLDEYQGVLVRADSDLHTVADLRGKRLAVPLHRGSLIDFQRGAAQHGYVHALAEAGLSVSDVTLVDIEAPAYDDEDGPRRARVPQARDHVLAALDAGEVDAVFIRFARGFRASRDPKYRQIINLNELGDPLKRVGNGVPRPITVDRAFLETHHDVVVRYLSVLLRTARWAALHRNEVADLLIPESGGATRDDVFASHGPGVYLSFTPQLTPDYLLGLETQKNFLRDWGYLARDFDIQDWIDPEPLAEARALVANERDVWPGNSNALQRAA
ncbi:ABC transporter substrate-binding protein [Chitinimonas sp. BJYL2]|uniref:ABC transporter substrate-binding protein n=1 Tax=Chitinimonas sp. BJYL2 TaxID=2976696 RepID=UPI0022B54664|nr:ABC transporter substrate-binding protein [Chitinimonas sp. BJYL2]